MVNAFNRMVERSWSLEGDRWLENLRTNIKVANLLWYINAGKHSILYCTGLARNDAEEFSLQDAQPKL